ncbi:Glycine receptor subunit alpha-3 [Mactra antiquata]
MLWSGNIVYLTLCISCIVTVCQSEPTNVTMSTILDEIFAGYDKKLPPRFDQINKQVLVTVNMYVNSIYSISEANMDYSISMFLRERWVDNRLKYNDTLNLTRLELDYSLFENVWMPDMYILNEKSSDYHEVTVPNKLIHVYPDGTVQYSARVTGIFSCLMHLQKYPFDSQKCHFEVESYGHSTDNMKFVWSDDAVSIASDIQFPQFELTEIKHYSCEKDYYGIVYPCIGAQFLLVRNYQYYIIQIYVPSILIVFLSWVNFWLDCTSVPARISLGLLTVLTMTTQSSGARANLPHVSYVKAIDVYMATCLTFVFLGLVEFAYVNVLTRTEGRKKSLVPRNKENGKVGDNAGEGIESNEVSLSIKSSKCPCFGRSSDIGRARMVDKISRILFPSTFLVFNIIYWAYYFLWDPNFDDDRST